MLFSVCKEVLMRNLFCFVGLLAMLFAGNVFGQTYHFNPTTGYYEKTGSVSVTLESANKHDPVFDFLNRKDVLLPDWKEQAERIFFLHIDEFHFSNHLWEEYDTNRFRNILKAYPANKYFRYWATTADLDVQFYDSLGKGIRASKLDDFNSQHTAAWLRINQVIYQLGADKERTVPVYNEEQRGIYLYLVPRPGPMESVLINEISDTKFSVATFVNSHQAVGMGVTTSFSSHLFLGITDAIQRWDAKAENSLHAFVGYNFYPTQHLTLGLMVGPMWHAELDDNQFDAFGTSGGLHLDYALGKRVSVFGQVLGTYMFEHQHGKVSSSYIYQDPNDPNIIGVKNDIIRVDKKFWRQPEFIGRVGLNFRLN